MKILMFGWEFPPHNVGGLGRVCYELTKSLAKHDMNITLILPVNIKSPEFMKIIPTNIEIKEIQSPLNPYMNQMTYQKLFKYFKMYGSNLYDEVERYTNRCKSIIKDINFDLIHAHDWMTFKAAVHAKQFSGKPLVLHVHTTEFERSCGLGQNKYAYEIEKHGFEHADLIITVSNFERENIAKNYGVDRNKIRVVHNATNPVKNKDKIKKNNKIVLYLGRITLQKGPDYFIRAAKKVLSVHPDVTFVMAGDGELLPDMINLACELGIGDKVLFTGFLSENDVYKIYQIADLYVMPSVSEPFGLTALESLTNETPILISKTSGVSEVLNHYLKVDFWDIDEMANKIISVLKYKPLGECLAENGCKEVNNLSWDAQTKKVIDIYKELYQS